MPTQHNRRRAAQFFNTLIDQALLMPSPEHRRQVVHLLETGSLMRLAERVRRRAARFAKRDATQARSVLQVRDELIQHLYLAASPRGWCCGWSDGACRKTGAQRRAGIGVILMDSDGQILQRLGRETGDMCAFDAELCAVAELIALAVEMGKSRLMSYTDNAGLVQLWHAQREDLRLAEIRRLSRQLERFDMRAVPRLHNQPANALARQALA